MGNIIMAAGIAVLAIVFFFNSFGFPAVGGTVSAGFWPRMVSVLLFITSGMATYEAIVKYRKELAKETKEQRKERIMSSPDYFPWGTKRLLGTWVLFGLYMVFALNFFGFILSTLVFVPVLTIWLGNKKYWQAALSGILTTVVGVVLFCRIMMIPMPRGAGIFRYISFLFY